MTGLLAIGKEAEEYARNSLVCPPLGAGVAPGARGGGRDGESVEVRHPVVPFSSRPVGSYAHDPRVEERTHTSQKSEAP